MRRTRLQLHPNTLPLRALPHLSESHPSERLRSRLMMVFALLAIAPLVIGALISLVTSVSLAQQKLKQDQQYTASTMSTALVQRWQALQEDLRLAATIMAQSANIAPSTMLTLVEQHCTGCRAVWWLAPDGHMRLVSGTSSQPLILSSADQVALEQGNLTRTEAHDDAGRALTLLVGVPVHEGNTFRGAMIAVIDTQQFGSAALATIQQLYNGYGYIVDTHGHLLVSPNAQVQKLGRDTHAIDIVAAATQGTPWPPPGNVAYHGLLQPRVVGIWTQVPELGWYVIVEAPLTVAVQQHWALFAIQLLLIACTGSAAVWLGRRLATTITQPLEQLQQGVSELQAGRWPRPLVVRRYDELGQLADAFNTMSQALQQEQAALVARNAEIQLANQGLEQALDAARTANVLKSQFVATISHELRTPLTAMLGFADMFRLGLYGELDDEQRYAIGCIHRSGAHLLQIINDLLDFSKLEAGKVDLHMESVDIAPLVANVAMTCTPQAQVKHIALHSHIDPDFPEYIRTDPLRLHQILLNIVANAVKFTQHGHVAISLYQLKGEEVPNSNMLPEVSAPSSSVWWAMEVADTGIGIAPEDCAFIFHAFRQTDGTYQRQVGGTGLGLSIAQHLVTLLGGTISVSSQLGVGSTFTVKLPLLAVTSRELDQGTLHVS